MTFPTTGNYAQQLIPLVLEQRAADNPDGIFAKVPLSPTSYAAGFRSVTNVEIVKAINAVAWLLETRFGKGQDFPCITYLGPSDLRYSIVVIAGIKAGYKTFLPSPRNSKPALVSLLSRLQCQRLVATTPEAPVIPSLVEEIPLDILHIPSLQELLDSDGVPAYPYVKPFQDAKDDPIFILHTSGSTGIPKPLFYTHKFITAIATNTALTPPPGFRSLDDFFRKGSFFITLPSFHIAGLGFSLVVPAFYGSIPIYPLPTAPPTTDALLDAVQNVDIDWAFLPPVMVDELGKTPALLDSVSSRVKYVFYTGGSVPQASGDAVIAKMGLYQVLGSSENATFPLLRSDQDQTCEDWNYVQIHPAAQVEFQHRFDDLHELVLVKGPNAQQAQIHQPAFQHFPDLAEYETRDLFAPHPTKPGLWTHKSRIDDVIVFLNGEKTNPVSFEHEVVSHPLVRAALVGGQQRFEACLLIEPAAANNNNNQQPLSAEEKEAFIQSIWPTVERANAQCPAHARIHKSKILLVDPQMPLPRAGKGTVQRQAAMALYADQLDQLYADEADGEPSQQRYDLSDPDVVTAAVYETVESVTNWSRLDHDAEFFSLGMDSLQVLRLGRELKSKFGLSSIAIKAIYANPSVELLSKEIRKIAKTKSRGYADAANDDIGPPESQAEKTTKLLQFYQAEIDRIDSIDPARVSKQPTLTSSSSNPQAQVVVLTGSTGSLGSWILNEILQDASVRHVYCFNRAVDSQSKQEIRHKKEGLPAEFPPSRVTFVTVDLSKPGFGLDQAILESVRTTVTKVIHNAWPVDFNKSLPSFRPSLDGVLNLISLAAHAPQAPALLFISSISSVSNYHAQPRVPETVILDPSCPANMGYGESKYIAERMLDYAARRLHLAAGAVRVGQIAGTSRNPRGWDPNQWFPSLILGSRYLGVVPESLGSKIDSNDPGLGGGVMDDIDWIPIDELARVIVQLGTATAAVLERESTSTGTISNGSSSSRGGVLQVFHAVNPHLVSWGSLLPTVRASLAQSQQHHHHASPSLSDDEIKLVPFAEWLDRLQSTAVATGQVSWEAEEELVAKNPAVKLLDFYKSLLRPEPMVKLNLASTLQYSESLASLDPIRPEWVAGWIKNWISGSP